MSSGARTVAPPELLDRLRSDGLRVEAGERGPVVTGSGDLPAEIAAATGAAALRWDPGRAALEVRGGDRVEFLQRMLTQGLLDASAGDLRRSLLLDQKGRILADLDLGFEPERILAVGAADAVATTLETLQRYVLRADVHFEDLSRSHVVLQLIGPSSAPVLETVTGDPVPATPVASLDSAGAAFRVARSPRLVPEGFEIVVAADEATRLWSALLEGGAVRPLGAEAAEVLRIQAGVPAHGAEITASEFPQEARLEAAVDFDKGCYLGQETVARIHYRGKVNRLLTGLACPAPLAPGAALLAGDKQVGTVTSGARRPEGDWLGLGYVRTERAEPGSGLVLADDDGGGAAVRVRDVSWWDGSHAPCTDPASVS